MAKVEITEEEANQAYVDGYNEARGTSCLLEDIVDAVIDDIKELTEPVFDFMAKALTFGMFVDEGYEEQVRLKEEKLEEIYEAGYQRGLEDKEEYGERD